MQNEGTNRGNLIQITDQSGSIGKPAESLQSPGLNLTNALSRQSHPFSDCAQGHGRHSVKTKTQDDHPLFPWIKLTDRLVQVGSKTLHDSYSFGRWYCSLLNCIAQKHLACFIDCHLQRKIWAGSLQ